MDSNVLDMCVDCVCVSGEDHILMTILIEPNESPSQQSALFQSLFPLPESELWITVYFLFSAFKNTSDELKLSVL